MNGWAMEPLLELWEIERKALHWPLLVGGHESRCCAPSGLQVGLEAPLRTIVLITLRRILCPAFPAGSVTESSRVAWITIDVFSRRSMIRSSMVSTKRQFCGHLKGGLVIGAGTRMWLQPRQLP